MDGTYLFLSLFFSTVGIAYFAYGKKQSPNFMIAGVVLMIYPYIFSETILLLLIGVGLMILPFLLDR